MLLRALWLSVPLLLIATTARADPPTRLELRGPKEMNLLERVHGTKRWRTICEGPCDADALPDATAEHVVKLGRARYPLHLTSNQPVQRVTLIPRPPAPVGGTILVIAGGVTAGVGLTALAIAELQGMAAGIGGFAAGSGCDDPQEAERRRCLQRRSEREALAERRADERRILAARAAVAFGVGVAMLLAGVVIVVSRPEAKVIHETPPSGLRIQLLPLARGEGASLTPLPNEKLGLSLPLLGGTF